MYLFTKHSSEPITLEWDERITVVFLHLSVGYAGSEEEGATLLSAQRSNLLEWDWRLFTLTTATL